MNQDNLAIQLTVFEEETDPEALEGLTIQILRELVDMGASSVERPRVEATAEAGRKGEAISIGILLLAIAPTLLPSLIKYLQAWTLRSENRRIKIKTPQGLEVEFTPSRKLSEAEILDLAQKLAKIDQKPPAAETDSTTGKA